MKITTTQNTYDEQGRIKTVMTTEVDTTVPNDEAYLVKFMEESEAKKELT